MDLESILNPLPTPPLSAPRPRKYCNKPYTLEQIHFLQYCRDDLDKLLWPDIVTLYIERFSDSARDVTRQGLQCRYYRTQLYPMLCVEGKPVHDNEGAVILRGITVRYRGQKEGLTVPILDNGRRPIRNEHGSFIMRELTEDELHGPVGSNLRIKYAQYYNLIDRVPELAAEYNWVKSEWRKKAKREATCRSEHGIALPGAVLSPGNDSVRMMLLKDAGDCCESCANLASEIIRHNSSGPVDCNFS